jgi:hypothetical protein
MMTTEEGGLVAAVGEPRLLWIATFSRAKTLSPERSTRQQAIGSSAGARNAAPVRRSKHA